MVNAHRTLHTSATSPGAYTAKISPQCAAQLDRDLPALLRPATGRAAGRRIALAHAPCRHRGASAPGATCSYCQASSCCRRARARAARALVLPSRHAEPLKGSARLAPATPRPRLLAWRQRGRLGAGGTCMPHAWLSVQLRACACARACVYVWAWLWTHTWAPSAGTAPLLLCAAALPVACTRIAMARDPPPPPHAPPFANFDTGRVRDQKEHRA